VLQSSLSDEAEEQLQAALRPTSAGV
jgi:uncharacterized membrane protein